MRASGKNFYIRHFEAFEIEPDVTRNQNFRIFRFRFPLVLLAVVKPT
jgi:hypothetical protein